MSITNANPDRQPSGFVWWSADGEDRLVDLARGIVPNRIRRKLQGTIPNPPGCGGAWYRTRDEAIQDFTRACKLAS